MDVGAGGAGVSPLLVALAVHGMPAKLALISMIYGAAFGLFPIAWIVFASIMLYRLAVDTGKFEIIKDSVGGLTNDRRLQALFIAFSFGAFIEGAAGFGAPVAISGAMLAGLGFNPFYAAGICLLANTAPVAFGSIGIPVTTLADVTGLPLLSLSAMVGRLCAMISIFIPAYLVVVMAGRRRALEVLPAIVACGLSFAGMQFYVSNYIGPELTDIASSLTCIVVMVLVLKLWTPTQHHAARGRQARGRCRAATFGCRGLLGVASVPAPGLVRARVGQCGRQGCDEPVDEQPPAVGNPEKRHSAERPPCPGPAQHDSACSAGGGAAGSVCGRLRVELAHRLRHVMLPGHDRSGARCCASVPCG